MQCRIKAGYFYLLTATIVIETTVATSSYFSREIDNSEGQENYCSSIYFIMQINVWSAWKEERRKRTARGVSAVYE